jgi:hypothetical protein
LATQGVTISRAYVLPEDKWPKQIGVRYFPSKKPLTYKDIVKDSSAWEGSWIKSSRYLPISLELCLLKKGTITKTGWWDGSKWAGYRIGKGQNFEFWKKTPNPHGVYGNHLMRKE